MPRRRDPDHPRPAIDPLSTRYGYVVGKCSANKQNGKGLCRQRPEPGKWRCKCHGGRMHVKPAHRQAMREAMLAYHARRRAEIPE